jgi:hypothetical protein
MAKVGCRKTPEFNSTLEAFLSVVDKLGEAMRIRRTAHEG